MAESEMYKVGWEDALSMVNGIVTEMLESGQFDTDTLDELESRIENYDD